MGGRVNKSAAGFEMFTPTFMFVQCPCHSRKRLDKGLTPLRKKHQKASFMYICQLFTSDKNEMGSWGRDSGGGQG